jgi:hypothetical protein
VRCDRLLVPIQFVFQLDAIVSQLDFHRIAEPIEAIGPCEVCRMVPTSGVTVSPSRSAEVERCGTIDTLRETAQNRAAELLDRLKS